MLNRTVRSSSLPKDVQTQRQIGERVVLSISVVFADDVEIYTLILESRCIKNYKFPRTFSGWYSNQELYSPWPRCGFIDRKNAHTHV